jgi:DNA invertase Pin-like site-specific DNA recombinase
LTALKASRGTRRRRRKDAAPGGVIRVIAYLRCSTAEQAVSGLGLEAQLAAIKIECERRGWELVAVYTDADVEGSTPPEDRPGLSQAITALDNDQAEILMTRWVDRLGRTLADLALLTPLAAKAGWGIVALNSPLDASTPMGAAMLQMMGVFAELELALIRQRTKDALAVKKAQGVKLGRQRVLPAKVVRQICKAHESGKGWSEIARGLNERGVPTAAGGKRWYPSTVRAVALAAARPAEQAA